METEGHVTGCLKAPGGLYLDVDMPQPATPLVCVNQMKVERMHFDKENTTKLLRQYGTQPSSGESWVIEIGSHSAPDFELYYCEENGLYGTITYDETSPGIPLDASNHALQKANDVVKAFLDDLGLTYEYPFFQVVPLETQNGRKGLIEVVARLSIEGLPFHASIGWTRDSDKLGNGDPTPGAFFIVSAEGRLTTTVIRNPIILTKQREDTTPILDWQSVLLGDLEHIMGFFCGGDYAGSTLALKGTEFVMMVDAHQLVYPAWTYYFTRHVTGDAFSSEPYTYDIALTYNARTGERVWHQ